MQQQPAELFPGGPPINKMTVAGLCICSIAFLLTYQGDTFAFVNTPETFWQKIMALLPAIMIQVTGSRTNANMTTFIFYASVLGLTGTYILKLYIRKIAVRSQIKKAREDALLQHEIRAEFEKRERETGDR